MIVPENISEIDEKIDQVDNPVQLQGIQHPDLKKDASQTILPRRSVRKSLNELYTRNNQSSMPTKKSNEIQPKEPNQKCSSSQQVKQPAKKTQFEFIYSSLMQLNEQLLTISSKVQSFDSRIIKLQEKAEETGQSTRRKGRKGQQFSKGSYQCPNRNCRKSYESEQSLNLHFKLKHCGFDFVDKLEKYLKSATAATTAPEDNTGPPQSVLGLPTFEEENK